VVQILLILKARAVETTEAQSYTEVSQPRLVSQKADFLGSIKSVFLQ